MMVRVRNGETSSRNILKIYSTDEGRPDKNRTVFSKSTLIFKSTDARTIAAIMALRPDMKLQHGWLLPSTEKPRGSTSRT
jgi:hypothetical protein